MMHILLMLSLLLIIPVIPETSEAAYNVHLKNGSVISGAGSYEKDDGNVIIRFGSGTIGIPVKDIVKIEDSNAPEKDFSFREGKTHPEPSAQETPAIEVSADRAERISILRTELDKIASDIRAIEERELNIAAAINEKKERKIRYNRFQLRRLENEIEPLQKELLELQQRKTGLLQKKTDLENELRAIE